MVALVKHVPDVQSARSFTAEHRLVRGGPDDSLNELDEDCLEAALHLVEATPTSSGQDDDESGDGARPTRTHRVTALTVGPPAAVGALRRALAMGATDAVHVSDEAVAGSDAVATARVVAAAVDHLHAQHPVDLVLAGMAALDGLGSLVPSAVAALLGWPQLTLADRVQVEPGSSGSPGGVVTVRRTTAHHVEELRAPLPAVVSVTDQAFRPRSPSLKGLLAARRTPVDVIGLADLGLAASTAGAAGSTTRVLDVQPRPELADQVRLVAGQDGRDVAAELADLLVERGF